MTEYPTHFGLEEDELMVVHPVFIWSDESDWTLCSSPQRYFLANTYDACNTINQLMIIQGEQTIDGTQPPTLLPLPNLSITHQRLTKLSLTGHVGHNDPQKGCCTAIPSATSIRNLPPAHTYPWLIRIATPSDTIQPSTSTTYLFPEVSIIAQDLQNLTLQAYMQGNANITSCLGCSKRYE